MADFFARELAAVAQATGTPAAAILSPSRHQAVADARAVLYWLLRERHRLSLPAIGDLCGRHHSSVLAGINRVWSERRPELLAVARGLLADEAPAPPVEAPAPAPEPAPEPIPTPVPRKEKPLPDNEAKKPAPDRVYQAKKRPCLSCRRPFLSSWSGERVCPACKSTAVWKADLPAPCTAHVGRRA